MFRPDHPAVQIIRLKNNIYATQFHPEADNEILVRRIRVYQHAGYFDPEEMDDLIEVVMRESVTVPVQILRRFAERYRTVK